MREIPRDILVQASEGSMSAFEEIYRATSDYVYTVATKITGNSADAEEVTQDVFVKVHRKLGQFRFRSSFTTWLYRIAVNSAISASRKSAKRRARETEYDDAVAVESGSAARGGAGEKEDSELRLQTMLAALNPDQRACIVLRGMEGMSYRAIADMLGININTVRSRLKRAREILVAGKQRGG